MRGRLKQPHLSAPKLFLSCVTCTWRACVRACVHACVCVCVCLFVCAEHVGGEAALPNLCRPAKLVHGCQKQGSRPC